MGFEDGTSGKLKRMRRDITGRTTDYQPNRPPDPYDQAQARAEMLQGRDREAWQKWQRVMEFHGFLWMEPHQLTLVIGPLKVTVKGANGTAYIPAPHKVGQWRRFGKPHSIKQRRDQNWACAFTMDDLLSLFVGPEDFDKWIRRRDAIQECKDKGEAVPDIIRKPKYGGAIKSAVPEALIVDNDTTPEEKRPKHRPNQATRDTKITTPEGG